MLRMILVFLSLLAPLAAQSQTAAEPSLPADGAAAPTSTDTLIELLRDEAAREELIRRLEAGAESNDTSASPTTLEEEFNNIGTRIAEVTRDGAQTVVDAMRDLLHQIWNLPTTVDGLMDAVDPEVVFGALSDLVFVIIVTFLSFAILRQIARRISRRLSRIAEGSGLAVRILLSLLSTAIYAVTVGLAWAAGYAITVVYYQGFGVIQIRQSLYLNAFLIVELAKVVCRSVLSPRFDGLRLLPLTRSAAGEVWNWMNLVISLLGYGLLLAVPIVNESAGYFSGSALGLFISIVAILYTMNRVRLRRMAVATWLHPDAATVTDDTEDTRLVGRIAALWHWPVQLYLTALLILVIIRPGNVLLDLMKSTALVVGIVVLGLVLAADLGRLTEWRVRLPRYISYRLPTLEARLNSFLPQVLFVVRVVIALVVGASALGFAAGWDIRSWISSPTGSFILSKFFTVSLILLVSFAIWLAFSSWIEYRLNPLIGVPPTARVTTLLSLLRNAVAIALLLLTTMFVLSEIGLDIGPLLASAGVLGLAIGFGAQKMVQDIITGVFIQFENAINVGDVITVGGVTGTVEKLSVRSVSLRDVEGVFHIIPFSSVDMVSNYMRDFSYHLADMGVAYREDLRAAKIAMIDAFEELRKDPELAPVILGDLDWFGLNSFGDSSIVLRARIKTLPGYQWTVGRAYNLIVKETFDARGIEIPFPHQTVYFGQDREGNAPPLHVRNDPPEPTSAKRRARRKKTSASPTRDAIPAHDDVSVGQDSPGDGDSK
ncbi:MAG: mechanosensitive ion channel domain-containing protein [Pseudomonadota bacterium]